MTYGQILRHHRHGLGLSQRVCAKGAGFGVSTWSFWELGYSAPSPENSAKASKWLGCDRAQCEELAVALAEYNCLLTQGPPHTRCTLGRGHDGECVTPQRTKKGRAVAALRDRTAGLEESIGELIRAGNEMSLALIAYAEDADAAEGYVTQWHEAVDEAAERRKGLDAGQ